MWRQLLTCECLLVSQRVCKLGIGKVEIIEHRAPWHILERCMRVFLILPSLRAVLASSAVLFSRLKPHKCETTEVTNTTKWVLGADAVRPCGSLGCVTLWFLVWVLHYAHLRVYQQLWHFLFHLHMCMCDQNASAQSRRVCNHICCCDALSCRHEALPASASCRCVSEAPPALLRWALRSWGWGWRLLLHAGPSPGACWAPRDARCCPAR